MANRAPTVFISYSHDNQVLVAWVRTLGERLETNGVNVKLDQLGVRPGDDLIGFMETGLTEADVAVVVSSSGWVRKFRSNRGSGARVEGRALAAQQMSDPPALRVIPIIRENEDSKNLVPTLFSSLYRIDFRDDTEYEERYAELLEAIRGESPGRQPQPGMDKPEMPPQQPTLNLPKRSEPHVSAALSSAVTFGPSSDSAIGERYHILLDKPDDWVIDLGNKNYAYNKYLPEFQIQWGDTTEDKCLGWWPSAAFFLDPELRITELKLLYRSTVIYETQLWVFDGHRRYLPKPSNGVADDHGTLWYQYYDLSSIEGKLLRMFTDEAFDYSSREFRCVQFLLFENEESRKRFDLYYLHHKDDFPDRVLEQEFQDEISTDRAIGHLQGSALQIARAYKAYQQWTEEGLNTVHMAHQPKR